MKHRIIATAIALLFGLSMPRGVAAKGHGGGHSGGGHSSGGHSGGGHSGGGHSSGGHSAGGHSAGGHASAGQSTGGHGGSVHGGGSKAGGGSNAKSGSSPTPSHFAAPTPPVTTSHTQGSLRPPDGHTIIGTAIPRASGPRDVFVVTPSIYAPHVFRPHFTSLGFRFGVRHLGYGFGPAYYGPGYDHPLLCETMINCDIPPVPGAVDVPPYEPPQPEAGSGSVRLDVQPEIAQIFVDGEYVGTVEDFKSASGLVIAAGVHRVEFRAPGYEPLVVDVRIAAGREITYRGTLKPPSP